MNTIFTIFRLLSTALSVYAFIVFARVMLTWIPSLTYTPVMRILGSIVDPYLNWFKQRIYLRFGNFDFTPLLAMSILFLFSSVFSAFVQLQRISVGIVLAVTIGTVWQFANSLLTFMLVFLIIRLVFNLLNKDGGMSFWQQFDALVSPLTYKIVGKFLPGRFVSFRTVILTALALNLVILFTGRIIFTFLQTILFTLPI